jgi:hypothetical protein
MAVADVARVVSGRVAGSDAQTRSEGSCSGGAVASSTSVQHGTGYFYDRIHDYLRHGTNARCAQPDSGQVESPELKEPQPTPAPPPQRFHFPWKFVSAQLTDSKGDEIFYPVNDGRDRQWARRLEWAINRHRDIAEDDLEELHADHLAVLRESREAHERRHDQEHIAELNKRLEATNKALRDYRAYGYCK